MHVHKYEKWVGWARWLEYIANISQRPTFECEKWNRRSRTSMKSLLNRWWNTWYSCYFSYHFYTHYTGQLEKKNKGKLLGFQVNL